MRHVAIFATEKPHPGLKYAGLPLGEGRVVYVRAEDLGHPPAGAATSADPHEAAQALAREGETMLNTFELGQ